MVVGVAEFLGQSLGARSPQRRCHPQKKMVAAKRFECVGAMAFVWQTISGDCPPRAAGQLAHVRKGPELPQSHTQAEERLELLVENGGAIALSNSSATMAVGGDPWPWNAALTAAGVPGTPVTSRCVGSTPSAPSLAPTTCTKPPSWPDAFNCIGLRAYILEKIEKEGQR